MTPAALRALASCVETEEPSEELRAAVLSAFGSEAEWLTAPNPLRSVDDAKAFQPAGWSICVFSTHDLWACEMLKVGVKYSDGAFAVTAPTEPRARTAAALHALAWDMEQ